MLVPQYYCYSACSLYLFWCQDVEATAGRRSPSWEKRPSFGIHPEDVGNFRSQELRIFVLWASESSIRNHERQVLGFSIVW